MVNGIIRKPLFWLILTVLMSFFSFNSLIRPGYFPMHDDMQAMRVLQLDKCVKDGQIPCRWVPDMGYGYGYPQFNYYPPLPYYVMEGFHLGGLSILAAVKIGFALSAFFSAIAMFIFGRSLFGNIGGFVSSVFYVYAPYRATNMYNRGAVGEFWALVFLPLIFWAILEVVRRKKSKYVVFLALSFAGLLLTHIITSMIFSVFALLWGVFLLWHFGEYKKLKRLAIGTVLGVVLAGFFILPVIFEKKFAHTETLTQGFFNYLAHFVSLKQLFTSTHWGFGSTELGPYDNFSFSIGLLHWVFGLVALVAAAWNFKKNKLVFQVSLLLVFITLTSLFMTHQKSVFIWNNISFLKWLQFPWRYLTIAMFSLSALVGLTFATLKKQSTKLVLALIMTIGVIMLNAFYFYPSKWYYINDQEKFSGESWEKQLTISIFDYLPIFADAPPDKKAPDLPQIIEGNAEVIEFQKGSDWQSGVVEVTSEVAIIRMPLYYFPGFVVEVDGQEVAVEYDNRLGLITFEVPQNKHTFNVQLTNTPVRSLGNMLTVVGVFAIIVWFLRQRKNDKK